MLPHTNRNPLLPALLAFACGAMAAGADWMPTAALFWLAATLIASLAAIALLRSQTTRAGLLTLLLLLF